MSGRAAAVACVLACVTWPAVAQAAGATSEQLRTLAGAALRDPAALERLRVIDSVDGRPVAMRTVLSGRDSDVRARLRVLAAGGGSAPSAAVEPARAREQAKDVLSQRRFQPTPVPAPLRSLRERIGSTLRSAARPFEDAFRWVASWVPGGTTVLALLLGVLVIALGAAIASRFSARRAGGGRPGAGRGGSDRLTAGQLRQQAGDAERRGDLELALRLRFRAGLLDLDGRDLIELRPALTDHELLRAVKSPTLTQLVDTFESVAYGGRPAQPDDVRRARDGWPRVVEEAARR